MYLKSVLFWICLASSEDSLPVHSSEVTELTHLTPISQLRVTERKPDGTYSGASVLTPTQAFLLLSSIIALHFALSLKRS